MCIYTYIYIYRNTTILRPGLRKTVLFTTFGGGHASKQDGTQGVENGTSQMLRRLAGTAPRSTRNACGVTIDNERDQGGALMTIPVVVCLRRGCAMKMLLKPF